VKKKKKEEEGKNVHEVIQRVATNFWNISSTLTK